MLKCFITGTGTEVGKTTVAAALLLGADQHSAPLDYWKPVQTGGDDVDRAHIEALIGRKLQHPLPTLSYKLAASPDQAAAAEQRPGPRVSELMKLLHQSPPTESLLIEGAGGLIVPLNEENETWLDFLKASKLPALLVSSSQLGTLNHTSLSLMALKAAAIPVLGVVLTGPLHADNEISLRRMFPEIRFLRLPQVDLQPHSESFQDAAKTLWQDFLKLPEKAAADKQPKDWLAWDKSYVWHPYTQHLTAPDPAPIVRAEGIYLTTADGEQLVDASASWWTCSLGHGRKEIGDAIRHQQAKLDHCIFAGATHEAGATLAARLIERTRGHLQRVFYSDNGSCAVEVALKIAAQYWRNIGKPERRVFLYCKGAYHGDTFGAMSVASTEGFHKAFRDYMFHGLHVSPVTSHRSPICPEGPASLSQGIADLRALFEQHSSTLAGVIIEPLLQGASGMNIQELAWLQELARLCRETQTPLILDEVFTGLGRIGDDFAFLRAQIDPDIVCVAKGLTGGTLPLAATLTKETLFQAFLDNDRSKALLHGHTFTGNPIACAAALATLELYDKEQLIPRVQVNEQTMTTWMQTVGKAFGLEQGRVIGGVMAWELPGSGMGDYFHPLALRVPGVARKHGMLMRTLGNTLYFAPPLAIKPQELQECLVRIERCVSELLT